jgi:hypothetical protein
MDHHQVARDLPVPPKEGLELVHHEPQRWRPKCGRPRCVALKFDGFRFNARRLQRD